MLLLALAIVYLPLMVVTLGWPGQLAPALERLVQFAPMAWMMLRSAGEPVAAALHHRIRPSPGALALLAAAFALAWSLLR